LKCGDVIWLHHSETNSRIAAARRGKAIDKNSFAQFNLAQWLSP
jgi:inositol 1,4,5-triphosphate receptor type 1